MTPARLSVFKGRKRRAPHPSLTVTWRTGSCRLNFAEESMENIFFSPFGFSQLQVLLSSVPVTTSSSVHAVRFCHLVHGPKSVTQHLQPGDSLLWCPAQLLWSTNNLWAWPGWCWTPAVASTPQADTQRCVSGPPQLWACTSLSGTQSSPGFQSCWNYYFSKVFARGKRYGKAYCDFGFISMELLIWGNAALPVLSL